MDGLLERMMTGTRAVLTRPELAVGLLLVALMVVAVRSQEEADG